jgi:Zn-dependent protease
MILQLLGTSPLLAITLALVLIISLTIHEYAHAFVADKLGDPTAKYMGRLTFNPLAHLDPLGIIALLLVGFGWGKPVPFNSVNLKNPRRDAALISFAGPLSNFLMAAALALVAKFFSLPEFTYSFIYLAVFYNLTLGFFNLIPIHPLDGFKVVTGVLPVNLAWKWQKYESYGMYILIIMIVTGITGFLISPPVMFSLKLLGF